jgi:hypothetical protein
MGILKYEPSLLSQNVDLILMLGPWLPSIESFQSILKKEGNAKEI